MSARVSIVMAAHNAARFVGQSISSLLGQSFGDFELLIMDDGSTDDTSAVISAFSDPRLRVFSQTRTGLTVALNRLIAAAQGELIARADADDACLPERLAAQVAFLDGHPEIGVVGSFVRLIDEHGTVIGERSLPVTPQAVLRQLRVGNPLAHPTVVLRAELLRRTGGYDETWRYSQDYALWIKLSAVTRLANIPRALVDYREHAGSAGGGHGAQQHAAHQAIRRAYWGGLAHELGDPRSWRNEHMELVAAELAACADDRQRGAALAGLTNARVYEANLAFEADRPDIGRRCLCELALSRRPEYRAAWAIGRLCGFRAAWGAARMLRRGRFRAAQEHTLFNWT